MSIFHVSVLSIPSKHKNTAMITSAQLDNFILWTSIQQEDQTYLLDRKESVPKSTLITSIA